MKERLKQIIDRLKELGYEIEVVDKRPPYTVCRLSTIQSDTNTELENLKAFLSYIVFYKSDNLKVSLENFEEWLAKAERAEKIKLHGEYPQEVVEIVNYILGDENTEEDGK